MSIAIRRIEDADLEPWLACVGTAFLERFDAAVTADQVRPYWVLSRAWGAAPPERAGEGLRGAPPRRPGDGRCPLPDG